MCEVTKCMHHEAPNRCKQALKMTCTRRYAKLHLKCGYVELKGVQHGI